MPLSTRLHSKQTLEVNGVRIQKSESGAIKILTPNCTVRKYAEDGTLIYEKLPKRDKSGQ